MTLEFKHVNYIYDASSEYGVKALDDISLLIGEGEFIGVIGATGSGKSTLMQHMNGLLHATDGEILFNGKNIYDKGFSLKALRNHVGFVFQYPENQLFETTVFYDVCFGPKNLGLDQDAVKETAAEALRFVGISEDLFTTSPFDMSGGQKRRVAIAGVLAMKPDILILDEPAAGLDPAGKKELFENIRRLKTERNMTVILVSHSMEDVAEYVDRLIVMKSGSIVYDDSPVNVFKNVAELEAMGLAIPETAYLMRDLAAAGIPVDKDILTVDACVDEIIKIFKNRQS